MRKTILGLICASASIALTAPAAVAAQAAQATAPQAGMQVKDPSGGLVGSVASVEDGFVTVATDRHQVRLPASSFTPNKDHLLFALTREQLNADVDRQLAQAQAQIAAGATVRGLNGAVLGTIDSLDDQTVTLKLGSGKLVRIPRSGIAPGQQDPVIGMTAEELEAATSAS